MACYHIHGDAKGETYLKPLKFRTSETAVGTVQRLGELPATSTGIGGFVGGRKPDTGMHEAPRRQFVVVLGGELEIVTSLGHAERLRPGDVLLADDVGSKGHISRDVGDQPLMMMTVGIGSDWDGPEG